MGFIYNCQKTLRKIIQETIRPAARRAAGLENRAYPDVKATANDTVKGIIFYFVLLLPFSVFCERLLFSFADIRKRIAGFAGIFVLIFSVLPLLYSPELAVSLIAPVSSAIDIVHVSVFWVAVVQ